MKAPLRRIYYDLLSVRPELVEGCERNKRVTFIINQEY